MTYDPSAAPRRRESGYKGDGWSVRLRPDGSETMLLVDTGVDSVAIARIPDGKWDRAARPLAVHAHDGYDETVLIPSGSGRLYHGATAEHITTSRFEGPVVLVLPARSWHHIAIDPGSTTIGTCFFTVPGTVVAPFAVQMELVSKGRVAFAGLPVVDPKQVHSTERATPPIRSDTIRARLVDGLPGGATRPARVLPYPAPSNNHVLALDTGNDSVFILVGQSEPGRQASGQRKHGSEFEPPEFIDLHRHPDVDEYIIRDQGAGYLLNGPAAETITLTPFRSPTVLVMPAGAFHRLVHTDDPGGQSILIYTDRHAIVEPYDTIMARTVVAKLNGNQEHGVHA